LPIHLGTSSLRRARQTALIIARKMGLELQVYTSLVDLNNGMAAGKTHAQAKSYANPPSEPLVDWQPFPQAETWSQFFQSVSDFMDQFVANQDMPAIPVTHSANIHVIIAWWLELSIESRTYFEVFPASITVLKMSKWGNKSIERMNDSAHLHMHGMPNPIKL
jgi:probable phosphoglycerate mutase